MDICSTKVPKSPAIIRWLMLHCQTVFTLPPCKCIHLRFSAHYTIIFYLYMRVYSVCKSQEHSHVLISGISADCTFIFIIYIKIQLTVFYSFYFILFIVDFIFSTLSPLHCYFFPLYCCFN